MNILLVFRGLADNRACISSLDNDVLLQGSVTLEQFGKEHKETASLNGDIAPLGNRLSQPFVPERWKTLEDRVTPRCHTVFFFALMSLDGVHGNGHYDCTTVSKTHRDGTEGRAMICEGQVGY